MEIKRRQTLNHEKQWKYYKRFNILHVCLTIL